MSDEFNGPQLDSKKWLPYQPYWKGRAPSEFGRENISVGKGELVIRSTSRVKDLTNIRKPLEEIWVTAGCVSSARPIATYGYYEARIRTSHLSMTSSFWLQGKYSEIDIAEEVGNPAKLRKERFYLHPNTHLFGPSGQNDATPRRLLSLIDKSASFHTYGAWWMDASTVIFYFDGHEIARTVPRRPFEEPMYLFFDTEVFKEYGLPSVVSLNDAAQNAMFVDWVHVWELVPSSK